MVLANEPPKPSLTVDGYGAAAQVTPDGEKWVVYGVFDHRADEQSLREEAAELRVYDVQSGRIIAKRACPALRGTVSGGRYVQREVLTPDARLYSYLENNRWMVVARVDDGALVHRVDLNQLAGVMPPPDRWLPTIHARMRLLYYGDSSLPTDQVSPSVRFHSARLRRLLCR